MLNELKISVVLPFYNAENTLELCLSSMCNQKLRPDEIILVDNNSQDSSKKIVDSYITTYKEQNIIYTFCNKQGPSAARNKGASIATGDWLIFTDSDCVPSINWVSDYVTHFGDDEIGAVAGCIQPYPPTNVVQKSLSLFTLPENKKEIIHDDYTIVKGLYPTANLAVRKVVFNLVEKFNENLMFSEDREFCSKIYHSSYKIKAVTNAVVEHIHRTSLNSLIKQSFGFGTGHPYKLRHLTQGAIILNFPFLNVYKPKPGKYIWIDFIQADKKLIFF